MRYYNDYLRPKNLRHHLSTTLQREGDEAIHLTFFRPKNAGVYEQADIRLLEHVVPHLERAVQIYQRLAVAEHHTQGMNEVVERCGKGVALLDSRGRLVFANSWLEKMIQAADGLLLTRDGLTSPLREAARKLHAAIGSALRGGSGGTLAIPRTTGAAPYKVVVSAIPARHQELLVDHASVIVIVSDPVSLVEVDFSHLLLAYGLTPAESRIAGQLANGLSVEATAARLRISLATARTHLKRILHKTGTHRQSELVRVLLLAALR